MVPLTSLTRDLRPRTSSRLPRASTSETADVTPAENPTQEEGTREAPGGTSEGQSSWTDPPVVVPVTDSLHLLGEGPYVLPGPPFLLLSRTSTVVESGVP